MMHFRIKRETTYRTVWLVEHENYIRTAWETNSATEIRGLLREVFGLVVTRNAVIGKLHRLGLADKDKKNKTPRGSPKGKRRPPRAVAILNPQKINATRQEALRQKRIAEAAEREVMMVEEAALTTAPGQLPANAVRFIDRDERECAWPVGENAAHEMMVCGNKVQRGSYCSHHSRTSTKRVGA